MTENLPARRDDNIATREQAEGARFASHGRRFVFGVELEDGSWSVIRGGHFLGDVTWETEYHWAGLDNWLSSAPPRPSLVGTDLTLTVRGIQGSIEKLTGRSDLSPPSPDPL